jgi:hypothetical protein
MLPTNDIACGDPGYEIYASLAVLSGDDTYHPPMLLHATPFKPNAD